jgi:hypothetical protein
MKTDTVTIGLLGVIALALVFIACQGALKHITPVQAATTGTPYEYKFITRDIKADFQNGYAGGNGTWKEDGKIPRDELNNDRGLEARIQQIGSEGWELAADVVFSEHMKVNAQKNLASNGVSTGERFIFKRPK